MVPDVLSFKSVAHRYGNDIGSVDAIFLDRLKKLWSGLCGIFVAIHPLDDFLFLHRDFAAILIARTLPGCHAAVYDIFRSQTSPYFAIQSVRSREISEIVQARGVVARLAVVLLRMWRGGQDTAFNVDIESILAGCFVGNLALLDLAVAGLLGPENKWSRE